MATRFILSLNGGGMRLYPALLLHEIYKRTGKHPTELFDMFFGVSTGAIMACLYNHPKKYSTEEVVNFYLGEEAKKIFKGKFIKLPWDTEKYPAKDIESVLQDRMGEITLKETIKPCIIESCDLASRNVIFFNSEEDEYKDYKLADISRASSAAPTYFKPFKLGEKALVDGGLANNDGSLCAYIEAKKLFPNDEIYVVRLGTGSSATPIPYTKLSNFGMVDWAVNLFNIFSDGQSDTARYLLHKLLPNNFFSFDLLLPEGMDRLDDASDKFLNKVIELFKEHLDTDWKDDLNNLITLLSMNT